MNKGVEILLARMDTHPEEFEKDDKWGNLYEEYKKFMEPEEQKAMVDKLKQLKMNKFEELIVRRLMREEREESPLQKVFGFEEMELEELKTKLVEKLAKVER
jgi:hypothetical protein